MSLKILYEKLQFKWILNRLSRAAFASFILVLPIGYYPENPDSVDFIIGAHGGHGQVVSVIRDCEGNPLASESSRYVDVSGSAYTAVPPGSGSPVIAGVRGGYWESRVKYASYYEDRPRVIQTFRYVNPNINLETRYVGLGIGYIFGDVPQELGDMPYRSQSDYSSNLLVSFHLRLGNLDKLHFAMSIAENTPLVSGGSYFDIGLGGKASERVRMFAGLSAGFYDQAGFIYQSRVRLSRSWDTEFALRIGNAEHNFEGSASGGLVYRFGSRR